MEQRPARWYEAWFDRDEYEIVYRHRNDDEAARLIQLLERVTGVRPGDSIVDVGCGRGRHAIRLARHGYRVTGLDLSARSIEVARARAQQEAVDVEFVVADMREALCTGCFDGAANLFTAFGYFEREEEHQKAIDAMAAQLRPGGWLFQDFLNAPHVRGTLVAEDRHLDGEVEIVQQRRVEDGRIRKTIVLTRDEQSHAFEESVRLFDLGDFRDMYGRAGLRLAGVYGDYEGGPHSDESSRLIMYAIREETP